MVGTTDSPWGRESVSGCCLRAGPLPHWWLDGARHRGEGRPAGIGASPITTSGAPQYRGPSVPAAADPRHDVAPEPSRPEARTKPTSLGTEWRCGDPSAGTVGQATRSLREGARVEGEVKAWCWTRERSAEEGTQHLHVDDRRLARATQGSVDISTFPSLDGDRHARVWQ